MEPIDLELYKDIYKEIHQDGKTVCIRIEYAEEFGWLLSISDKKGNSSGWNETFPTSNAAMQEALDAIKNEGIDEFIGPQIDFNFFSNLPSLKKPSKLN